MPAPRLPPEAPGGISFAPATPAAQAPMGRHFGTRASPRVPRSPAEYPDRLLVSCAPLQPALLAQPSLVPLPLDLQRQRLCSAGASVLRPACPGREDRAAGLRQRLGQGGPDHLPFHVRVVPLDTLPSLAGLFLDVLQPELRDDQVMHTSGEPAGQGADVVGHDRDGVSTLQEPIRLLEDPDVRGPRAAPR